MPVRPARVDKIYTDGRAVIVYTDGTRKTLPLPAPLYERLTGKKLSDRKSIMEDE